MTTATDKDRRGAGFTLIEVLVAMALMAVALLAVFKLQAQNLDLLSEAHSMTVESYLARGRLARIGAQNQLVPGERSGEITGMSPLWHYREEISVHEALKGFYRVKVEIRGEETRGSGPAVFEVYLYRRER